MKCYIYKTDKIILDIRATNGNDYEIMEEIYNNQMGMVFDSSAEHEFPKWLTDGQTGKKFLRMFL